MQDGEQEAQNLAALQWATSKCECSGTQHLSNFPKFTQNHRQLCTLQASLTELGKKASHSFAAHHPIHLVATVNKKKFKHTTHHLLGHSTKRRHMLHSIWLSLSKWNSCISIQTAAIMSAAVFTTGNKCEGIPRTLASQLPWLFVTNKGGIQFFAYTQFFYTNSWK